MNQPVGVCCIQCSGNLPDDGDGASRGQRAVLLEHRGEIGSLDQPHVDEQPAFDLAVPVDRDDMCLPQPRGEFGLTTKARPKAFVGGQVR